MVAINPHPGLADLPVELLELIVEPLELKERVRLSCCNRGLLRRLAAAGLWEELTVTPASVQQASDMTPWLHRHRHAICSLSVELEGRAAGTFLLPPEWHAVFVVGALGGGALESLELSNREDSSPALEVQLTGRLVNLPHLSELSIGAEKVSVAASFSRLSSLTRLYISNGGNAAATTILADGCLPPSLRALTLGLGDEPVDALPAAVAQATGLQQLVLEALVHDVSGLRNLAALTSLGICLGEAGIPGPVLELTGLRDLMLMVSSAVYEEELEPLSALTMLTCIELCSGGEVWGWQNNGNVIGHLPGSVLALPQLQELVICAERPPTSLRPLPLGCVPVLQELTLCTTTASQGAGPATLASLTSLTSLHLCKLHGVYYHEGLDDICRQVPIAALAALMAALGSLPRLHSLTWELGGFDLTADRPLACREQRELEAEARQARGAEMAAALQALRSGVRPPPASRMRPPESLRDLQLKFPRDSWGGSRRAAGFAELVHKLGLLSWVAGAAHLETLVVCADQKEVAAALQAAAPPGAVVSVFADSWYRSVFANTWYQL